MSTVAANRSRKTRGTTRDASRAGPRRRGYLLLEVMASGAILAVILGGTITVVARERQQVTAASHRARAAALAQDLMQQILADNGPTPKSFPGAEWTAAAPTTPAPGFVRHYGVAVIATAGEASLGDLYQVKVRVQYPTGIPASPTATIEHHALRRDRLIEN